MTDDRKLKYEIADLEYLLPESMRYKMMDIYNIKGKKVLYWITQDNVDEDVVNSDFTSKVFDLGVDEILFILRDDSSYDYYEDSRNPDALIIKNPNISNKLIEVTEKELLAQGIKLIKNYRQESIFSKKSNNSFSDNLDQACSILQNASEQILNQDQRYGKSWSNSLKTIINNLMHIKKIASIPS